MTTQPEGVQPGIDQGHVEPRSGCRIARADGVDVLDRGLDGMLDLRDPSEHDEDRA
jgi:hypothetical protein